MFYSLLPLKFSVYQGGSLVAIFPGGSQKVGRMGRLDFFLHPASIAVVGASQVTGKVGHTVLRNIITSNFTGRIYPINKAATSILNLDCYASVLDVPDAIDVAVLCIPAGGVPSAAEECGRKGVRGLVVVGAGFREVGGNGVVLEAKLKEVCTRYGLRCVGPNALGNITTAANMSFAALTPLRGKIAMLSQSGAMMTAVLDWAQSQQIGFSHFISLGNKMDVDEVDFIEEIAEDEETSIIILYLESVESGDKFMRVVPDAARKKPIVILKSGVSAAGKEAACSHTGALTGNDVAFDLAFARAGVSRARSMKELFDLAGLFDKLRGSSLAGDHFMIVTNAGGPGVVATDAFEYNEVPFTVLTAEITARLRQKLPNAVIKNPLDIIGDADPRRYSDALSILFAEPSEVCAGAVILVTPQSTTNPNGVANVLVDIHLSFPDRLLVGVFMGGDTMREPIAKLEAAGVPCYRFPEPAAAALREVLRRQGYLAGAGTPEPPRIVADHTHIEEIISTVPVGLLGSIGTAAIMDIYGIPRPASTLLRAREDIGLILDFPIVMKVVSPDITHKSEYGGVRLDIRSREAAAAAYDDIIRAAGDRGARVIGVEAQEMVQTGYHGKVTEVIVGMDRDPTWGPLVMVGAGGIYANYVKDIAFELAKDYSPAVALAQLQRTKIWQILDGVRGEAKSDITSLVDTMVKVADLATNHPEIASLDINPLFVYEDQGDRTGVCAVDVKIILQGAPAPSE